MIETGSTILLASITPGYGSNPLVTLSVALVFAAIFLFGGRAACQPGQKGRRRFLSFAGGLSVAYTFVHVLPALGAIQDMQTGHPTGFYRFSPEYSVYLWSMAGFLVFYGLETLAYGPIQGRENRAGHHGTGTSSWRPWVHIGGFALYAWLLTYCMVWTGKGQWALGLFAVAMGMHLFPVACHLRSHYQALYDRRGAFLLALACLGGWASALTLNIPRPIVFNLVAIVAGGVIVNAAIAELPKEKEGRFWSFVSGALIYTVLLLILFHFEKGE
jgi:hypothetical protein